MNDNLRQLAALRRSGRRRLCIAYAGVLLVTLSVLSVGGAWVGRSLGLQAAAQMKATSAAAELSCANQILGYAVDIGSAPSNALPVQLLVNLQQALHRCDDAWRDTNHVSSDMKLNDPEVASLDRLTVAVDASHDDMSASTGQVITEAQSGELSQRALVGAAVTRLAAKVGAYVNAVRTQSSFFADIANAAMLNARLQAVTTGCGLIGILIFSFAGIIAPLQRKTAAVIESSVRSLEQDRRLGSDIARQIAERDRNEAEAQFKALFEQSSVGVLLCDQDDQILESNPALRSMLGFTADELRRTKFGTLIASGDDRATVSANDGERLMCRKDATKLWIEQTTTSAIASDNRTIAVIRMIQNIESRKAAEARLQYDATHDALTGLRNRKHFDEAVEEAVNAWRTDNSRSFGVIMLDVDGFKHLNDSRGHAVGDAALAEMGQRLSLQSGPKALVSRYGGDEFTVFLPHIDSVMPAVAFAQNIQQILNEPLTVQGSRILLSASAGICLWNAAFSDGDALLHAADSAVYKAKAAGRGRLAIYDASMAKEDQFRRAIGAELRDALDKDAFDIAFQPIVGLHDRVCLGFEALARWNHPTLGSISPADFIPVAEELGLVCEIGERMLRKACGQLALWRGEHDLTDIKINVNVSSQQLSDPEFAALVAKTLRETNLDPKKVALELTETAIFESQGQGRKTLDELRLIGTPIVLDDFGTGFSSLTHLQKVPMDALKVDQSFVRGEDGGLASTPIVETLIAVSKALGINVVAEGVETERQAALLHAMGCDDGQGYYFSKPLTAAGALDYLLRQRASSQLLGAEAAS